MRTSDDQPLVFLSSITSDIGIALAHRYSKAGFRVAGTYRSTTLLPQLKSIPGVELFHCDLKSRESIDTSSQKFAHRGLRWNTFIALGAQPQPLTAFFKATFDDWEQAVHVNAVGQMRQLHRMHAARAEGNNSVVLFAGPGTNNAPADFSAAVVSKVFLIKMCELLDAENPDLNVFIVGPGWTKTKTHYEYLADPNVSKQKYEEVKAFIESNDGTPMDDIFRCIRWLEAQGRTVAGGRNFSVVHDQWRGEPSVALVAELTRDRDMYKLRRFKNEFLAKEGFAPK